MSGSPSLRVWPQYVFALICNLGTLAFGLHLGWLSPLQAQFQSNQSPLGPDVEPFTLNQISWIGCIPAISLMFGPFIFGISLQRFGRKLTMLFATIPNVIAILILIFAKGLIMIYIGRAFAGVAACIFMITPIYVNESVQDDIRGQLGGMSGIFINIGVLLAYVFGTYTSYLALNLVAMSFPVMFLLAYFWLPESPQFLLARKKHELAIKSLQKLRGGTYDQNAAEANKMLEMIERSQNLKAGQKSGPMLVLKNRTFRHGMGIMVVIFFIQQFTGISAILAYNSVIFQVAGTTLKPSTASILMAVLQMCGSIIGVALIEKLGRRILLLTSSILVTLSLLCLSLYMFFQTAESRQTLGWIPVLAMSFFVTSYAAGFGTIAYVLLPELFPPQARPYASAICGTWVSFLSLLVLKFFPTVSVKIQLSGSFTIFTIINIAGAFFIYFFVFETKGKSLSQIMHILGDEDPDAVKDEVIEPLAPNKVSEAENGFPKKLPRETSF